MLPRFLPNADDATVVRLGGGLINHTFLITVNGERFVLQRVNDLFPPTIHLNIQAVTAALADAGITTPRLIPTRSGDAWLQLDLKGAGDRPSVWRLMTHVEGSTFDVLDGPAQARAAGALVARFHAAVDGLAHTFVGLRTAVHDTARHLETLASAVRSHPNHRLSAAVGSLAAGIHDASATLPPFPALPARVCHGDLKINNFLFAGPNPPARDQAICLIDLDTVGPMPLAFELGDAWRSWCNRNGEDHEQAALDLAIFEASLQGYLHGRDRDLGADERRALLLGPEWISLELSARFAADALAETYFGWDAKRFPGRGEHNLVRARGQFSLFQAFVETRAPRASMLDLDAPDP